MRVAGHVPAFSTADNMIEAGYDGITHINQFMLGWVIGPSEDTRTLFRITALKRLPALDLNSPKVQHTIQLMVDGHKAIDPTLGIHERLTLSRDGQMPPGAVDYLDHMPVGYRRNAMKADADMSAPGDDQAYRGAFEKMLATVRLLRAPAFDKSGANDVRTADLAVFNTLNQLVQPPCRVSVSPFSSLSVPPGNTAMLMPGARSRARASSSSVPIQAAPSLIIGSWSCISAPA